MRLRLDLADAFGRDLVAIGQLVQRGLAFAGPAADQDVATARIQPAQGRLQIRVRHGLPLLRLDAFRGVRGRCRQVRGRTVRGVLLIAIRGRIERHVAGRQPLLHLGHFGRGDAEVAGDGGGLLVRQPGQVFLHAAQVEEQLALRLGRCHLDQAPVAQHVFVDLGAHPVHGKRHQAHVD